MSIESKVAAWEAAGVIDADTRGRIEAYERAHARPILLYALGGLGAMTIGIGLISIVAANWDEIGKVAKLALDLLLGMALAGGLYTSVVRGQRWLTEVLVGVFYIYVLASLALVGQIYQLGSPTHHALLAWSLSTLPMMLLVRSPYLALLWLAGLWWTEADAVVFYLDRWDHRIGVNEATVANTAVTIGVASLVLYKSLARLPWMLRERAAVSATWTNALWTATLCGGLSICFAFYANLHQSDVMSWSVATSAVLLAGLAVALPRLYAMTSPSVVLGMRFLLGEAWLAFAAATSYPRDESEALGACFQVAILATAAWTVLQMGRVRLFNSLTGLIGLRILVMYFEVFGSMLSTGVAMISGGMLTLAIAWLWKRKSPELASRFAQGGPSHEN